MTDLLCEHCGRKLGEASGSYLISINCRRCKQLSRFCTTAVAVQKSQHPFEDMIAQPN